MNEYLYAPTAFGIIWLVIAFFYKDNNMKQTCITRSAIFIAAGMVIDAINHLYTHHS